MKSNFAITVLIIILAIGGTLATRAMANHGDGDRHFGRCDKASVEHREGRMEKMAQVLGLSEEQKQQIETIVSTSKEANRPIREKLWENKKAMRAAASGETIDRDKVRALAAENANLKADLLISRVETRKQVNAVLSPEQQQLMEKIRPLLKDRHGKHHKHQHGPGPGPSGPADS